MMGSFKQGFTVVELVIVIVIIGILAGVVIISYGPVTSRMAENTMKSDLSQTEAAIKSQFNFSASGYPDSLGSDSTLLIQSDENTLSYTKQAGGFCVQAHSTRTDKIFHITDKAEGEGECPPGPAISGDYMQDISAERCTTERVAAVDARDKHSYWIQKMADGKCWMLTNLSYAGGTANGGTGTYGDVKSIISNPGEYVGSGSETRSYTSPMLYIDSANARVTVYPTLPVTSSSVKQYGYYYNWCAAMGGQTGTSACANSAAPLPDASTSVCPAGWRLPTGGASGELKKLTDSLGGDNDSLKSLWLAQYAGVTYSNWDPDNGYQSSTQQDASQYSRLFFHDITSYYHTPQVAMSTIDKSWAVPVRCIAK